VRDQLGRVVAGVRLGTDLVDLAAFLDGGVLADLFTAGRLEPFLEAGPQVWADVRGALLDAIGSGADERLEQSLLPLAGTTELMPFDVADYVDFYASRDHASNIGRMLRPDGPPLSANWEHMPIGYHGRAGTVVVSGTPIKRPNGQHRIPTDRSTSARRRGWISRQRSDSSSVSAHRWAPALASTTSAHMSSAPAW
jgi:fumarylacetoacetase